MTKKFTPFLKPNEVLSETEVDYLKEKSNFKGIALLLHAWFVIGLSILVIIHLSLYLELNLLMCSSKLRYLLFFIE